MPHDVLKTQPSHYGVNQSKEVICASFGKNVTVWKNYSDRFYILCERNRKSIKLFPLYILSFQLFTTRNLTEAERLHRMYPNPDFIQTVSDKLRYYRYQNGLRQIDVCNAIGLDRSIYISYETEDREYYPIERMEAIASLFELPVEKLLDKYNRFLYEGQGQNIKKIRKSLRMKQTDLANLCGLSVSAVKRWGQDAARMPKASYLQLLKLYEEAPPNQISILFPSLQGQEVCGWPV